MDCSLPGSSVHGIFQVRVLEWFAMPSPNSIQNTVRILVPDCPLLQVAHKVEVPYSDEQDKRTSYSHPWLVPCLSKKMPLRKRGCVFNLSSRALVHKNRFCPGYRKRLILFLIKNGKLMTKMGFKFMAKRALLVL